MRYIGNVYRPPSEAYSFIVQATVGCAHNTCTFCSMYKDKNYYKRELSDILSDLDKGSRMHPWDKVFLADGDALSYDTEGLLIILKHIYRYFPHVKQVSCYATVQDILQKTEEELRALKEEGLQLLYIGMESGNDEILKSVGKKIKGADIVEACNKAKRAGFKMSLTLISGLGSYPLSVQHAEDSAAVISAIVPDYVAFLTLMIESDTPMYNKIRKGIFELITPAGALQEMKHFIERVDAPGCVFRANHASNYAPLAGTLNEDKQKLINQIDIILEKERYKPEYLRRL